MKTVISAFLIFLIMLPYALRADITSIIILNKKEQKQLRYLVKTNKQVAFLADSIRKEVQVALRHQCKPLKEINYEGLLDTDPKRIETVRSFDDINHVATLIYAGYLNDNDTYGKKVNQIIVQWAKSYVPDGNTINENKLVPFFWGYHLYRHYFSTKEQALVEDWLNDIAVKQMNRLSTPNNNWEAKRLKLIGTAGIVLGNTSLLNYAAENFRHYISTAYFSNGTSNDLLHRDALSYHISGIKPCLLAIINLAPEITQFNLYDWESETGSSLKKAVEFVVPYATGEKKREEWRNSQVELDHQRAAAGLEKYQPGILFKPEQAYSLFELAGYLNPDFFTIFEKDIDSRYTSSWIGLLNSPLVRDN